jgi:hypothetical protein
MCPSCLKKSLLITLVVLVVAFIIVASNICHASDLSIEAGATMVLQGTGHNRTHTDASYSADFCIGREYEELGGKVFAHLEAGMGDGLENDLIVF